MDLDNSTVAELDQQMDEAVVAYLRAESAGAAPDRAEFLRRHSAIASELNRFFADRDMVARIASPIWQQAPPAPRQTSQTFPWVLGDYEVLAEIGRGGMGVVYRARQYSLNRLVALKMIAANAGGAPDRLARFYNEAQAAAKLQHPNVVQIFEIGEHDGQPYFAMEYAACGSLAQHLAGRPIQSKQAARIVETLARAVHAAHRNGVIHRDLKPANILIQEPGMSGKTELDLPNPEACLKITDFGLAKQIDTEVGTKTESGTIVGTPCYMAPEQAEGRGREPAPATDIYSLGALMYELLTGRPPFVGVTRLDTLHQIVHDEPVPPGRLQSAVPRDLETICLKCLHKEPAKRYATALELADDLRRFQAGEPIRARAAGRIEIAWHWCRRQPVQASLAASLIIAIVVGVSLVSWQWLRAESELEVSVALRQEAEKREKITDKLRQEAVASEALTKKLYEETAAGKAAVEKLHQEAVAREVALDESYRLAHLTLKDFMVHTVERGARDGMGLDPQRRELLVKSRDYYKRFLERRKNDPALRQELAEVSGHLANITRQIGTPEEALEDYGRALGLFEELLRADPESVPQKYSVAVVHSHIGSVQASIGRHADALASLQRSRKLLEESLRVTPDDKRIEAELASTLHNIAMLHSAASPREKALAAFAEARELQKKLLAALPDSPRILANIAATHNGMGVLHGRIKPGNDDAFESFKEAVAIRERLARRYPGNLGMQNDLAESLCNLSDCLRHRGKLKDSLDQAVKAMPILEGLVATNPHATRYRLQLAMCYANIGIAGVIGGDVPRGLAALVESRKIMLKLTDEFPTIPDYQRRLADLHERVASAHSRLNQHEQALASYQEQLVIEQRFVAAKADEPRFLSNLALTIHNIGVPLEAMGRFKEARRYVMEAVKTQQRAVELAPKDKDCVFRLAKHYAFLTHLERSLGNLDVAMEATQNRSELCRDDAEQLVAIAQDHALTAAAAKKAKRAKLHVRCADLAIDALRAALKTGRADIDAIRKNTDFRILHEREDYRKLLNAP
ncbi:MAG TPA: protein kinase [Gemmataceae bacterium]|nr:protein kinase [Gemmataceae bacterium]